MVGAGRRFPFGLPRTDNANYLWIQLFYWALNARGCAGFLMANSASDARSSEQELRQKLIEARAVDVMVAVGHNMVSTVTLPFRTARIVYDATVRFTQRFLEQRDRTVDQMIQVACSGKQNILEGCMDSSEALFVRRIGARSDESYESYRTYIDTRPSEIVANILICLIHQTNYLLDQQLRALETAWEQRTKGPQKHRLGCAHWGGC
jgi:hypothetical protein